MRRIALFFKAAAGFRFDGKGFALFWNMVPMIMGCINV